LDCGGEATHFVCAGCPGVSGIEASLSVLFRRVYDVQNSDRCSPCKARSPRLADIRFRAHYGLKSDIAAGPRSGNNGSRRTSFDHFLGGEQ
jgi:hypothetical protein